MDTTHYLALQETTGEIRLSETDLFTRWGLLGPDRYCHMVTALATHRRRRRRVMGDWDLGLQTGVVWGPNGHRWMRSPIGCVRHIDLTAAKELFLAQKRAALDAATILSRIEDAQLSAAEAAACDVLASAPTGEEYERALFGSQFELYTARPAPRWLEVRKH